ncbi:MAG: sensor domain-containing diguanylate cyclase, partial [Limisphaerales bacterium]
MVARFVEEVLNPARLAALHRLGLVDTPTEEAFDRLARLAARTIKTPVALVTLVDDQNQFFKSCLGLPEPW